MQVARRSTADIAHVEARDYWLAQAASVALPGGDAWVRELRSRGADELRRLGFPTMKHEAWKYTSLAPFLAERFVPATALSSPAPRSRLGTELLQAPLRLVFVD